MSERKEDSEDDIPKELQSILEDPDVTPKEKERLMEVTKVSRSLFAGPFLHPILNIIMK